MNLTTNLQHLHFTETNPLFIYCHLFKQRSFSSFVIPLSLPLVLRYHLHAACLCVSVLCGTMQTVWEPFHLRVAKCA